MKVFGKIILVQLLVFCLKAEAQREVLSPLNDNSILKQYSLNNTKSKAALRTTAGSIDLPFADDFYPLGIYPDASLWADSNVYINTHYPVNPISLGVATFDGLNKNGLPYNTSPFVRGIADILTSKPINLSGLNAGSNVYLSFYFQPKGNGQLPENSDILFIEFLHPADGWVQIWQSPNITDEMTTSFTKVFLSVEEAYLYDGFQFRFKNIAALSGNNDHWHIDYVELDKDRNPVIEQNIPDVSFQSGEANILKRYFTMPYSLIDSNEIADTHKVVVKNNFPLSAVDITDRYSAEFTKPNQFILNFEGGLDFLANQEERTLAYPMFELPELVDDDTVNLEILYRFRVSLEDSLNPLIIRNNNLTVTKQFSNYFAYDDGTPERAYQLEYGTTTSGSIAIEYYSAKETKLRGVRFHVANYNTNLNNALFSIQAWKKIGKNAEEKDSLIYEQPGLKISEFTKENGNSINDFYVYALNEGGILTGDSVLNVKDTFYIGLTIFRLSTETLSHLPLGYDVNNSSKIYNFYKSPQDNQWIPSDFEGSIIFNPIVGKKLDDEFITPVQTPETEYLKLYPNPATDRIRLDGFNSTKHYKARIYSIEGRVVKELLLTGDGSINVKSLIQGYYIVEFYDQSNLISGRARFIKAN